MKFKFRRSGKKSSLPIKRGTVLRLRGRNTLHTLSRLPTPIEEVRLGGDAPKVKRPSIIGRRLKALYRKVYLLTKKLLSQITAFIKFAFFGFCRLLTLAWQGLLALAAGIEKKRYFSLPMLLGALTSTLLVCLLSASYVLLGLFAHYARSYETVTIPKLSGYTEEMARQAAESGSFNLIISYENNPEVPSGTVISQAPTAGVTRRIYEKNGYCDISLTVSRHKSPTVPNGLVGQSLREASLLLLNSQLDYTVKEEYSKEAAGSVISAYPACGSEISKGECVQLTVSLGERKQTVFVPYLLGGSETEAVQALISVGLKVGNITYESSSKPRGSVIAQSTPSDTSVTEGTKINLIVSLG